MVDIGQLRQVGDFYTIWQAIPQTLYSHSPHFSKGLMGSISMGTVFKEG